MTARNIYHIANLTTIVFFAVLGANILFDLERYMKSVWFILAPLLLLGFILQSVAKKKDSDAVNPMREVKLARWINFGGLAVVLAGVTIFRGEPLHASLCIVLGILLQVAAILISIFSKGFDTYKDQEVLDEVQETKEEEYVE